jgi:DNA-binding GntR family transcriptional regulator
MTAREDLPYFIEPPAAATRADRRRTTRTEWAEERLRTAIVTGELKPGERLSIEKLAAQWDVSPTPLREAVRALAQAGLVELSPHTAATVSPLSLREIHNIYELRLLLEPRALRQSHKRRSWQWRGDVETAWHALQEAWTRDDPLAGIEPVHTRFHQALASACGNDELLRLTERLSTQSIRIRLLAIEYRGGTGPSLEEHQELYEAFVEGTIDEAMRRAIKHIAVTINSTIGSASLREIAERIAEAGGGDPLLPEVLGSLTERGTVPAVDTRP